MQEQYLYLTGHQRTIMLAALSDLPSYYFAKDPKKGETVGLLESLPIELADRIHAELRRDVVGVRVYYEPVDSRNFRYFAFVESASSSLLPLNSVAAWPPHWRVLDHLKAKSRPWRWELGGWMSTQSIGLQAFSVAIALLLVGWLAGRLLPDWAHIVMRVLLIANWIIAWLCLIIYFTKWQTYRKRQEEMLEAMLCDKTIFSRKEEEENNVTTFPKPA